MHERIADRSAATKVIVTGGHSAATWAEAAWRTPAGDDLPAIAESAPLWQAVLRFEEGTPPRLLVLGPAGLPPRPESRPGAGGR